MSRNGRFTVLGFSEPWLLYTCAVLLGMLCGGWPDLVPLVAVSLVCIAIFRVLTREDPS